MKEVVVVSNDRGRRKKYQEKVILELHRGTAIHGKVVSTKKVRTIQTGTPRIIASIILKLK